MPGRKQTPARKLFNSVASTGKMRKVQCKFCKWTGADNGTRLDKHLSKCPKCPDQIKRKYSNSVIPVNAVAASTNSMPSSEASLVSASTCQNLETIPLYTASRSFTANVFSTATSTRAPTVTVSSFVDRMDIKEQTSTDELLARAVYGTATPSIVESPLWQELFAKLRPSYTLPSRYSLSNTLLYAEYGRVSCDVTERLASSDGLALTCDGWSNRRNQSIINFIVTTPHPIFYKTMTTGAESHTGEYMAKKMSEVIDAVGESKFVGVVTDNASNMKAAWDSIENKYPQTGL